MGTKIKDRIFGSIEGVSTGATFASRSELHDANVHRPTQAGISGSSKIGADSIVISGGYEDDEDFGQEIIYTGHGGNDPNTGQQIANQSLTRGNMALAKSCIGGLPVRVVRGSDSGSDYAPKSGFRYDGLYYVESYWSEIGKSGFRVWRFKLVSESPDKLGFKPSNSPKPNRVPTTTQRIIRNGKHAERIKQIYDWTCQFCGIKLETPAGNYAEACHIRPLGSPHDGTDELSNLLCLCPNHHVLFDYGSMFVDTNFKLNGENKITVHDDHKIDVENLNYHFDRIAFASKAID